MTSFLLLSMHARPSLNYTTCTVSGHVGNIASYTVPHVHNAGHLGIMYVKYWKIIIRQRLDIGLRHMTDHMIFNGQLSTGVSTTDSQC